MPTPLSGVTVLDLSRVLSGPFATQQLADLGADIIKVERPGSGDDTRAFGPPFINGESSYFMSINRAKRSVAIHLKHDRGKALVRELAATVDVVIENFRPGTAERLGIGLASLRQAKPELITCSISGYGATGDSRYSSRGGYDAMVQGASGFMSITGEPDGEPMKTGVAISDMVSGLFAAQGILAALYARRDGGGGKHVEVSMQDAMCSLLTYQAGSYFASGASPRRMGNAHPSICPYESVQTADGPFVLAVGNDGQFRRFAKLVGDEALADDPRFATNAERVANHDALLALIGPALRSKTRQEWDELLAEENIPGGPVLSVAQAIDHPQIAARGSVLSHEHPTAGTVRTVATPVRFDGRAPAPMTGPPTLGQHTREVLGTRLGLDDAALDELEALGVIAS